MARALIAGLTLSCGLACAQTSQVSQAGGGGALAADATVTRERRTLTALERVPFDGKWWAGLSDWQNGAALSNTTLAGRPVLILTWTDYLPTAKRAVSVAQRMSEKFAKDGLIVLMVHPATEWASAGKPKPAAGATLLVAQDTKGEFRAGLQVDQDPDFYVIDRAGQLRFADITLEAVERACEIVTSEKADDAKTLNDRLAAEQAAAAREARRTSAINTQATFTDIPELPFSKPRDKEYEDAAWPRRPLDESRQSSAPGTEMPANPITLPTEGWFPKKPETKGRVIFAYLFHPKLSRLKAWNDAVPQFDLLQRQYGRDLVVMGLLTDFQSGNILGVEFSEADKDPVKLAEEFKKYSASRKFEHYLATQFGQNIYLQAMGQANSGTIPIPSIVIISSDGVARWWTHEKNRVQADAALLQIIRADPGVRNRRAAEAEWLKNNGKAAAVPATPEAGAEGAPGEPGGGTGGTGGTGGGGSVGGG